MNGDDQRIMRGTDLDRAARFEVFGVGMGKHQLAEPLQRHQQQDDCREAHAAFRKATQLAVKPGPSAVSSERLGSPLASARSSTNSTVGADMLPKSAMTSRS